MPVVRVDGQVWRWLQAQARPFEDTPNSVLRRVALLDPPSAPQHPSSGVPEIAHEPRVHGESVDERPSPGKSRHALTARVTGRDLNRKFRLGARHALYHKDGTFYERLERFPGVLCDTGGFVRYGSEQQFVNDARLNIGEKVNVHESLLAHPRYQRFPAAAEQTALNSQQLQKRGD